MDVRFQSAADAILRQVTTVESACAGRGRDGREPRGRNLSGSRRRSTTRRGRADDDRQRIRAVFAHQGDHRDRRAATRRGGPARTRRPGEALCARDRDLAGARRLRRRRRAEAASAEARNHDAHAAAAHRRVRLSLLEPDLQAPRRAGSTQPSPRDEARADDAAAVRPRRALGIRPRPRLVRHGDRGNRRRTPRRGLRGAHLRAARNEGHRLRLVGFDARAARLDAPARGRRRA